MKQEEREKLARWFRVRVVMAPTLALLGAVPLACGYEEILPMSLTGAIVAVAVMLMGFAMQLTLSRCPFCGARINWRSGLILWNYTCPHCHTSVANGEKELRTGPRRADASPAAFRRKVKRLMLALAAGFLLLLASPLLDFSPVLLGAGVIVLVPVLVILRTMRCPGCGAVVASQTHIFALGHFHCSHCGFSADGAEPEP